jgi:predicted GNAT family acetyltransferase
MDSRITIRNSVNSSSYDAVLGDEVVGTIVYERQGNRMIIMHTLVDPEFRGQGIATALTQTALDDLATSGMSLTNYCGFITDFIDKNPGYARVVDADKPGRARSRDATPRAPEPGS